MKVNFIRSSYQRFYRTHKAKIDRLIQSCMDRGDYVLRKDLWDLEKNFAKFVGTKYAVGVNSGTDALFLSLKALGIGKGDEVITVSNTFVATIQAIVHCGAKPILVDVREDELMDIDLATLKITDKTKAIIPVQYTGAICDMKKLNKMVAAAEKVFGTRIHIVDDACQAVGAKGAGTFGILNCFSFNTAKLMGGICDGGMITTNDRTLYEKLCLLRNHWNIHQLSVDRNDYPQPEKMEWGYKSRLANVNAAFLNFKLKKLPSLLKRREQIATQYSLGLANLPIGLPHPQDGRVWQEYHIRVDNRGEFVKFLQDRGIETLTRDTTPNHKMEGLGLERFNLPVTEKLAKEVTRLPLYPELTAKEVKYIIKTVREFYGQKA